MGFRNWLIENGMEKLECDSVILSVGYKEDSLYKELNLKFQKFIF